MYPGSSHSWTNDNEPTTYAGDRDVLRLPPPEQGSAARPVLLSWIHRVHIALDAARGLEYLHEMVQPPVTHKDVRSTNVLLFEGFRAKIADYNMFSQAADMARLNRSTHTLGSFGYQAPEYVPSVRVAAQHCCFMFGIGSGGSLTDSWLFLQVRHDGPDDGQERRVQLRHRSPGAPDG
jgi:serine/threonine protein kinase